MIPKKAIAAGSLAVAYALAMFQRTSFTELSSFLGGDGGLSEAAMAWVGSSFFWAYLMFQIPAGIMVDAAGARRVSAWGSAAMAAGSVLFASSHGAFGLACGRALIAAGAVSVFLALLSYCGKAFGKHSSSALGKALLVGNLGGIAAGAPLAALLAAVTWRHAWAGAGLASAAACAATLLLIPKEEGAEPILKALRHTLPSFARSMHRQDVYLGAGAMAGLAGAFHAFAGFGARQMAESFGMGTSVEGALVSAMVAGFALGAWLWGRLGDRSGSRSAAVRAGALSCAALWFGLSVSAPSHPAALGALLFATGMACGSFGNVYAILDELTAPDARGAVKAAANCGIALGAAVAQVAQGALPARLAALPCLLLSLAGLVCVFALARKARETLGLTTVSDMDLPAENAEEDLGAIEGTRAGVAA